MLFAYVHVQLVKVTDADTVHLDIDLGFNLLRRNCSYRLARINAPEIATPEGKIAKAQLETLLAGKRLAVLSIGADKYGRWLIELSVIGADGSELNVNDWLLANGYAAKYS